MVMDALRRKITQKFSFAPDVKEDEADLRVTRSDSSSEESASVKVNSHVPKLMRPNSYYNHLQVLEVQDDIQCIRVIDAHRIAVGLKTGRILIWDTLLDRVVLRLHNHQGSVRLLELITSGHGETFLLSVGRDELINIWDLVTSEPSKQFVLHSSFSIRLIRHIQMDESSNEITLLCAHIQLSIVRLNLLYLGSQPPVTTDVVRPSAISDVIDVWETNEHILCISNTSIEVFDKVWEDKSGLTLRSTDMSLLSDRGSLYSCSALISDELLAVGTLFGRIYVYSFNRESEHRKRQKFSISDSTLEHLRLVNRAWMAAATKDSIHLLHMGSRKCCYEHIFTVPITTLVIAHSGPLLTLCKDSTMVETWDLSTFMYEKKPQSKDTPQPLQSLGLLAAHDSKIKGVDILVNGVVTYGADNMVIVWKNKDEELLRLFSSVKG